MKTFLVSALEPSANLHLKEVLRNFKQEFGNFELLGIFDEALCEEFGLKNKPLYSSHEFSAMGFVEVLPLIFKAKRAIKELANLSLETERVGKLDAVLCIDSPAFNMPLAKALKKSGLKTRQVYYILPQVWAWKKGRIPIIEANFDILASILPFDSQFFTKSVFVGHPLLDEIKEHKSLEEQNEILTKKEHEKLIAFLPGSRKSEIKRLMPIFKELASKFEGKKVLCVPSFNFNKIPELYGDISGFGVQSNTPTLLKKTDFAFICSGTATLEATLVGTPFVLAYKAKRIDFFIAKFFVKLKYIGLANLICDFGGQNAINPELLQAEVNVPNLLKAYESFDYANFFSKVAFVRKYLKFGSAFNVAKILNEA